MSTGYYRLGGNVPGKYLSETDPGPGKRLGLPPDPAVRAEFFPDAPTAVPTPKGMGFTGNECTHCGSTRMLQTGHCETCQDCGETSACS